MAEKPFTGLTACVKTGEHASALEIGYLSGFDLDLTREVIEVLRFKGTGYKEKVAAAKDWKATIDGTAAFSTAGSQAALVTAYEAGTELTVGLYLDDTTYFEGKAIIQGLKISAKADGKIDIQGSLEGSGAIVLTMPAA